jgi:hypothetical protein
MTTLPQELADFPQHWADAERRGDVAELEHLLTDDFTAVGPRGFVLDKARWLDRYASGALVHDDFAWTEVSVRQYGGAAVAVGVQGQQSIYEGRDLEGHFRITQTIVEEDGCWKLAGAGCGPAARRGAAAQPRGTTIDWTEGRPRQSLDATVAWALASWATLACASAADGLVSSRAGATFCESVMNSR